MGVNTSRVLRKVTAAGLDTRARKHLISRIISNKNKYKTTVRVYATQVVKGVAERAHLFKKDALASWYLSNVKNIACKEVVLYSWDLPIKDILEYVHAGRIRNLPVDMGSLSVEKSPIPLKILKDIEQNTEKPV